jgi:hypothetical protein
MSTPDIYSISKSAFTDGFFTCDESETIYLIDEVMAMTAVILGRKPNSVIRNRVSAINRYIELVTLYPSTRDFWSKLADALDSLAGLMNSSGNGAATKEMRRLSASSRDVETRLGMFPKHHA